MALRPVHTDRFDDLMLEAAEAARAGVFGTTPINVEGLMARPVDRPPLRLYRLAWAGVPMAACVALFLGLAAFWRNGSPSTLVPDGNATLSRTATSSAERCETLETLRACLAGPGIVARTDCLCVDKDADGDVDLRDLGIFQLEESRH